MQQRAPKGAGSFKTNADGSVTYRKSVGRKTNGQRKVLTVTAATKTAAMKLMKAKEQKWEKEKEAGILSGKNTLEELCKRHLEYQVDMEELRPKSVDRREVTIENHIASYDIGHMSITSIDAEDIERHVQCLMEKLSASSVTKVIDVINAAYNWAIARGDLESNPVAPIKTVLMKRVQKMRQKCAVEEDVVVLSELEQKAFLKEASKLTSDGKYQYSSGLYLRLLLATGMRCGELLALTWGDVDLDNGFVLISKSSSMAKNREGGNTKYVMVTGDTKNSHARKIKITAEAVELLTEIKEFAQNTAADDLVCVTLTGAANTTTNLEHRAKVIFKNAGLENYKGGLHIFRRTFATNCYRNGARTKEIAAYIGDLETTIAKYYVAARNKVMVDGTVEAVVLLPAGEAT